MKEESDSENEIRIKLTEFKNFPSKFKWWVGATFFFLFLSILRVSGQDSFTVDTGFILPSVSYCIVTTLVFLLIARSIVGVFRWIGVVNKWWKILIGFIVILGLFWLAYIAFILLDLLFFPIDFGWI